MAMDFWRQLGILDPNQELNFPITIIGVGGIGSPTEFLLAKLGCADLTAYDKDILEAHNFPNQMYRLEDLGKPKVEALKEIIKAFTGIEIKAINAEYVDQPLKGVVISAVDSMPARKQIWKNVKNKPQIRLYIDAGMGGEVGQIYAVNPCDPDQIEFYEKTLIDDEKAVEAPCTERAIIYNVFWIAGVIGDLVKKFAKKEKVPKETLLDCKNMMLATQY